VESTLLFENRAALDPSTQYVIGVHPHAALPVGTIMQFTSRDWDMLHPIPRDNIRVLVASVCFYLPVLREMYLGAGFVDASKFSAKRVLEDGRSVMLFPLTLTLTLTLSLSLIGGR